MKLHEIVEVNKIKTKSILIEKMLPYKKLLLTYYKSVFISEPILMVTSVTNAASYGKIVPSNCFSECVQDYIESEDIENENNDEKIAEYELICFHSINLSDL